jgi:phosphoribosyl 1,2-cyclic phosphodiesterase
MECLPWRPLEGEIIFVGTGTSEGIPVASCLTKGFERDEDVQLGGGEEEAPCRVCFDAMRTDVRSPNRRRNTSMMIRWRRAPSPPATQQDSSATTATATAATTATSFKRTHTNVLIDCGKFFWESALEWFPRHRVRYIDALLITHRHNDACYGLDDLRDWTKNVNAAEGNLKPLEVHLREEDLQFLAKPFDYLVDTSLVRASAHTRSDGPSVMC